MHVRGYQLNDYVGLAGLWPIAEEMEFPVAVLEILAEWAYGEIVDGISRARMAAVPPMAACGPFRDEPQGGPYL